MNALVFLYKRVLKHPLEDRINAIRADKKVNVPVVITREEVAAIIALLDGTPQLVAKLLYGSGLRIMEAVRLSLSFGGPMGIPGVVAPPVFCTDVSKERP